MKTKLALAGIVALILIISCNRSDEPNSVLLNTGWKFKTGDDPAWATPAFDDRHWGTVDPSQIWEEQGYKGYDGMAWYRLKIPIRSSLKDPNNTKDSLQIMLGKIDDCDQVFLNGELIGENGRTIYSRLKPGNEFTREKGIWNLERRYILALNDPRIQ